jgi:hypothetical protein
MRSRLLKGIEQMRWLLVKEYYDHFRAKGDMPSL